MLKGTVLPNQNYKQAIFPPLALHEELRPETLPDVSGVAAFDSSKLKHVETKEKVVLPTADGKSLT
jgi:hypothetical protein